MSSWLWGIIVGASVLCGAAMTLEWLLRHVSWARLDAYLKDSRRRRAVEFCLFHEHGVASFCVAVGLSCVALLSAGTVVLIAELASSRSLGVSMPFVLACVLAVCVSLLFGVFLPALINVAGGERILIAVAPFLARLVRGAIRAGQAFAIRPQIPSTTREATGPTETPAWEEADRAARDMAWTVVRLRRLTVGEIMTPRARMLGVAETVSLDEARALAVASGHTRFPVWRETPDDIVGVLYAKDLLRFLTPETSRQARVADVVRRPYFVPHTKPAMEMLEEFKEGRVHMAIVLDEHGGTAGLVTIEDIIEEVFGEIRDEYDYRRQTPLLRSQAGVAEVSAALRVEELNNLLHVNLPGSPDYETVGGFLACKLGRVPHPGEEIHFEGLRFVVLAGDTRRVDRLRVETLRGPEQ